MKEIIIYNSKKEDSGIRRYTTDDGKEIACYYPPRPAIKIEKANGWSWTIRRALPEKLKFNTKCLGCTSQDYGKPIAERAKADYREDVCALIERYPDATVKEYIIS